MTMVSTKVAAERADVTPATMRRHIARMLKDGRLAPQDARLDGLNGYVVDDAWLRGWLACRAALGQKKRGRRRAPRGKSWRGWSDNA